MCGLLYFFFISTNMGVELHIYSPMYNMAVYVYCFVNNNKNKKAIQSKGKMDGLCGEDGGGCYE